MKTPRRSRSQLEARAYLASVLRTCEFYQSSQQTLLDSLALVRTKYNLPARSWAYLDGYVDGLRESWNAKQVYVAEWQGQWLPMKWNDIPEEFREHCRKSRPYRAGFAWLNKDGTPGKMYFIGSTVNEVPSV